MHPILRPTYEEHIKDMFEPGDISCMINRGVNLSTYEGVRASSSRILEWVGSGRMPPPSTGRTWSADQLETFKNWTTKSGFAEHKMVRLLRSDDQRVRKSVHEIDPVGEELKLLKKAFEGIMASDSDADEPSSFFNLAGIHWLPGPHADCRHHDNAYNPWHRAYLHAFEDGLRSIKGCENVTLPYWDLLGERLPDWLYQPPFYPYELPHALNTLDGARVYRPKGTSTVRDKADEIVQTVRGDRINIGDQISAALAASSWERFNGWSGGNRLHSGIIRAHDAGHGACGVGSTVSNQNIAAFDPLFWFFHCNWDRLWWKWQTEQRATDLPTFRKRVEGTSDWLDDIPGNILSPFDVVSSEMIDASAWNITYEHPASETVPELDVFAHGEGHAKAEKAFRIASIERYSVRVKNINRLNISGSFYVVLYRGDDVLRETFIFQPTDPNDCNNCRKNGVFSLDFHVSKSDLAGDELLKAVIERTDDQGERHHVEFPGVGAPTINVRLLLNSE